MSPAGFTATLPEMFIKENAMEIPLDYLSRKKIINFSKDFFRKSP